LAVWSTSAGHTGPATRTVIAPGATETLLIKLIFNRNAPRLPVVTLSNRGTMWASIVLVYVVVESADLPRQASTNILPSGLGEWWSPWYRLCLGKSDSHHTLIRDSVSFSLQSEDPNHIRGCGAWAQCRISQADDNDVCADFTVQGHHETNTDELVHFRGMLGARYRLVETAEPKVGKLP
jgi:hypothetical protein